MGRWSDVWVGIGVRVGVAEGVAVDVAAGVGEGAVVPVGVGVAVGAGWATSSTGVPAGKEPTSGCRRMIEPNPAMTPSSAPGPLPTRIRSPTAKPSVEATSRRVVPAGRRGDQEGAAGARGRLGLLVAFVALLERLLLGRQERAGAEPGVVRAGGVAAGGRLGDDGEERLGRVEAAGDDVAARGDGALLAAPDRRAGTGIVDVAVADRDGDVAGRIDVVGEDGAADERDGAAGLDAVGRALVGEGDDPVERGADDGLDADGGVRPQLGEVADDDGGVPAELQLGAVEEGDEDRGRADGGDLVPPPEREPAGRRRDRRAVRAQDPGGAPEDGQGGAEGHLRARGRGDLADQGGEADQPEPQQPRPPELCRAQATKRGRMRHDAHLRTGGRARGAAGPAVHPDGP